MYVKGIALFFAFIIHACMQPFGYKTIGTTGEVIFSLLVTLSTFGAITVNIVGDTRYIRT